MTMLQWEVTIDYDYWLSDYRPWLLTIDYIDLTIDYDYGLLPVNC